MNLQEEFLSLNDEQKRLVQFILCENAVSVLNRYFAKTGEIEYVESIVGTAQIVDSQLPSDAFDAAQSGKNLHNVNYRFAEPITAMQEDDLVFPEEIEFAYFSIYNLFQKFVLRREIDDWVIVNQAVSAEQDENKWSAMLKNAIEKAR